VTNSIKQKLVLYDIIFYFSLKRISY
jgi:hypothetical protein